MLNFIKKIKARRMNKIVEEVTRQIEEKMDFLFDDFVSKMNGQLQDMVEPKIDYGRVVESIDYSEVAYFADTQEIADYISVDDIAYNIDVHEVANNIDHYDIAQHFDALSIAQEIEVSDIAEYVNIDSKFDDFQVEIINEVEGMISDAVDDLEITRG